MRGLSERSSSIGASGDTCRDDGTSLPLIPEIPGASGNGVEQISQLRREEWFRNVHAVHAIGGDSLVGGGGVEDLDSVDKATGRDTVDPGCEVDTVNALGMAEPDSALLGTPQRAHILAAAGLRPGGFRWLHTSQTQVSKLSPAPS
jgi:hypothetical protein